MSEKRIVFTNVYGKNVLFYMSEGEVDRLCVISPEKPRPLGSVVIGRVKKLMESSNACFVDIGDGEDYFLKLPNDLNRIHFADDREHTRIKCEDHLLVQVHSERVKLKAPCVTWKISMSSRYWVIEEGKGFSFSGKIRDRDEIRSVLPENVSEISSRFHIILRTEARESVDTSQLKAELDTTLRTYESVFSRLHTCVPGSVLYRPESEFGQRLFEYLKYGADEVVTDLGEYVSQIGDLLEGRDCKLRIYDDAMLSLCKLYKLESAIDQALAKRVYLKSGGFLIIEQGETLCAIDVNSGHKISGQKEETSYRLNLEAAAEIFRQLKIRNISGMILIDFINLSSKEHMSELIRYVTDLARNDDCLCRYIDMTGLGLVELTRKRIRMSLSEQWRDAN